MITLLIYSPLIYGPIDPSEHRVDHTLGVQHGLSFGWTVWITLWMDSMDYALDGQHGLRLGAQGQSQFERITCNNLNGLYIQDNTCNKWTIWGFCIHRTKSQIK